MPLFSRDPHQDELDSARAEYDALELAYSERVNRLQTYRDEGNRVRDPNVNINSLDLQDYGRRRDVDDGDERHQIPLPLGKAITVKHAFRIAGRLPDVVVDQRDDSPFEDFRSDSMEKIVWATIRASKGDTTLSAASWNASEVGAGCLDMYWDFKRNMPLFRSVDPIGIYEVPGVDDPHDFQRIYRTWDAPLVSVQNEYRGKFFRGEPVKVGDLQAIENVAGVEMARIVQLCDANRHLRFALGRNGNVPLYEYIHNYGFTPYTIIPNLGPYEQVWGWADYEFVRALTEYIPLLFSREADVLKAVAAGAYQEMGTGQSAETIRQVIRRGGVATIRRDSKIEPIEAAQMPAFAESHADRAMDLLDMLGFTPDAAWGRPGSGSGTDRGLQLQPLMEYTAMKQLNWQAGLNRLFGMAFRMIEQKMTGTATYRGTKLSGKGRRPMPFSFTFGPDSSPQKVAAEDEMGLTEPVDLPTTPKELFDGDYDVRFVWRNMVDPDDPAFVMSEVNKFSQGLQSMETTLENLGYQAPEDEMKRIEKEAERFPWVNQGLVSLLMAQLRGNAQGSGGGATPDVQGALAGAMASMTGAGGGGESGSLDADAAVGAMGGTGQLYGSA